jgi:general stress protein 26
MKNYLNEELTDSQKLSNLIDGIDIAMLTTRDINGRLHSRPMVTQEMDASGDLWLFTDCTSLKILEVTHEHRVNMAYVDPKLQKYISISGSAVLVADPEKMEELWKPIFFFWFPKGLDEPRLSLLRIQIDDAEYWDFSTNRGAKLASFAKSLTGRSGTKNITEHGRLSFKH